MVGQIVHAPSEPAPFRDAFARIRTELDVPAAFPADVVAEADAVVPRPGRAAGGASDARRGATCRS